MPLKGTAKPAERRVMTRLAHDDVQFLERIAPRRGNRAQRGGVSQLIAELLRPQIARLREQHQSPPP